MDILFMLLIMVVCLILEGFFSGSEIGVISADQIKLRHDAAKGSRGARLALKMLKKPEWLLSTTLVGTNIAVVTNTTIGTALMIQLFGDQGSWLAILLVAPLIWIFGEIVPKSVFQQRADVITPYVIFILRFASYLFFPILMVFSYLTHLMARLFGNADSNPFTLREQIITMLQMPATEGDIQPVENTMIRRMFSFSETTVQEVMVPLIDVVGVEKGISCGEAVQTAVATGHVRLPVHDKRVDQITGVLYTLDLLGRELAAPIASYVQPVRYVPGTKSIKDLLLELRQESDVVAVVVDEFGGTRGIVTIEDIMEEVVEEIEDEYDSREDLAQWIRRVGEQEYIVNARIELDDLEEQLGVDLPKGKYVTLAGMLLSKARDVPPVGTVIEIGDVYFTIKRGTPQAIQEVRMRW